MSISKLLISSSTAVLSAAAIAAPGAVARTSSQTTMCRTAGGAPCLYGGGTASCVRLSLKQEHPYCLGIRRELW